MYSHGAPASSLPNSPFLRCSKPLSPTNIVLPNVVYAPTFLQPSTIRSCNYGSKVRAVSSDEIPPNVLRRRCDPQWRGGFSLGVDLGMSRTGLALSKGFSIRPLTVLELRGEKLELQLLQIAERAEADEFIVGLPKSSDGKETPQSNKVRSIAGRLAVRAAEKGWRVYLQDEHGTTEEATNLMICRGLSKSDRQRKIDAYAAMMVLERYFSMSGNGTELVVPKNLGLQEKLLMGPPKDIDFFPMLNEDGEFASTINRKIENSNSHRITPRLNIQTAKRK